MGRPQKIQTTFAEKFIELMDLAARNVLADAIRDKFRAQGLDIDGFPVHDLIEHMLAGHENNFVWDDGKEDERAVAAGFTKQETDAILSEIEDLLNRHPEIFEESLQEAAKILLRQIQKSYPEERVEEQAGLYGFRRRLEFRWGVPLNLFRLMLSLAREFSRNEAESLSKSKAKKGLSLREVLLGIHARALRTATAVLVLLENGLADEAYARWRTLYELSVVAEFISEFGEEAACRYRDHESVSLKRRMDNELEWGAKDIPKRQQREINRYYNEALDEYGKDFKNPYGWAARFISGNVNPKFVDLEQAVKGKKIVPSYKESSFQVHSGRAGLLGISSLDDTVVTAHSNAGLDIPLMHSSLCLMQVTISLLSNSPSKDLVILRALMLLNEKINAECVKTAKKLESDENALNAD